MRPGQTRKGTGGKRKGPVPGGRAVATPWEWLERPSRRGMMWDGMQPPAMGETGYSHAFCTGQYQMLYCRTVQAFSTVYGRTCRAIMHPTWI